MIFVREKGLAVVTCGSGTDTNKYSNGETVDIGSKKEVEVEETYKSDSSVDEKSEEAREDSKVYENIVAPMVNICSYRHRVSQVRKTQKFIWINSFCVFASPTNNIHDRQQLRTLSRLSVHLRIKHAATKMSFGAIKMEKRTNPCSILSRTRP